MKYTVLIFIAIVSLSGCNSSRHAASLDTTQPSLPAEPVKFDYYEQTSWLLGFFEAGRMKREPHAAWFISGFDNYTPSSASMNRLMDLPKENLSIKIILGSWCPDSRREVPRFMKILDLWKFPGDKITFIGTDINKISPVGDYESLAIERVPTFIIYENNIEAGRIIEVPKTSLEQDIVNILTLNE
jgi:thiol-disulfide isomerase/thioredoxin